MARNANRPRLVLGKLLAVLALCVAVWFLAKAFVWTDDAASGVIRATPEKDLQQRAPYPTPVPGRSGEPLLIR
ncbi:MAG: hypothetical protein ABI318_13200 [Chthoniobacteraceae bacterium]